MQTFQNVNKHFQQVFRELVPNGHGQLALRSKDDAELGDLSAEDIGDISNISGIGVEVSFHNTSNVQNMQSLSGGQKALVALALIFAIQRCDPAPFYLFDEIGR
ncbi:hypothetical protein EON64_11520 [archaeon]|nr:MAG: hypothetical protein EON64_11520 [archaeon]